MESKKVRSERFAAQRANLTTEAIKVCPRCFYKKIKLLFVQFSFVMAFIDVFVGRVLFCWLLGIVLDMGVLSFFLLKFP